MKRDYHTENTGRGRAFGTRPMIEPLESRIAPATINVTSLSDHDQAGKVTLRDAINVANLTSGTVIEFGNGTTPLHGSIDLTSPLPSIITSTSINGPGITINGLGKYQDFSITGGTDELSGLTLTGGKAASGGGVYINDSSDVTIFDCTITGNHAIGNAATASVAAGHARGGGIFDIGTSLFIKSSKITGNSAIGGAGAKEEGSS